MPNPACRFLLTEPAALNRLWGLMIAHTLPYIGKVIPFLFR
jgi:hypothetical protein